MARLVMHPQAYVHMDRVCEKLVEQVTDAVHHDALRNAPVNEWRDGPSARHGGPPLISTIHATFIGDKQGQVHVGTDHWQFSEYGTAPHVIHSRGPWKLRNRIRGQIFGYTVHHPGSPEQAYMRKALYQRRVLRYVVL